MYIYVCSTVRIYYLTSVPATARYVPEVSKLMSRTYEKKEIIFAVLRWRLLKYFFLLFCILCSWILNFACTFVSNYKYVFNNFYGFYPLTNSNWC